MSKPTDTIRQALAKWIRWLIPIESLKGFYNFRSSELAFSSANRV